ncbi:hypothetical protein GXW74_01690 [Roseomonas eburnea]|uniref:Uncharacterized protein n=1 Tax=Neoroseomonas eburnea TaxID=1346889 RepID=A0A9X9X647_9PROT|nr:hypothetical protein [Neoroseomonas eburnea]MBR0679183.1 hypothetical protein [Neoroseomonas eburnea]
MTEAPRASTPIATDRKPPIEAAASAVEQALAEAHEAGDLAAVRLLHAVLGLLCVSASAPAPASAEPHMH